MSYICPHCNQSLKLAPNNAFLNAEIYGNINRVVTVCCKNVVTISRKITFEIGKSSSDIKEDDWGNKIQK
jgi:hypothetical protein